MILYPTPFIAKTVSLVTSGLIIQLDANNSSSYPGTGTTVFDITGSYNHTLTGATYTVLNGIKCFDCTAGNNRVVVNETGPTLPTTGYTYITWTRMISSNSGFRTLLYTNSPKYTPITIPNGTSTLGYWDTAFRSSGYDVSSSGDVWVQFAVVGDNSSQTFYINGSQVGSTIAYGSGGITHWGWGNNDLAGQPWGYVANMYLYNRKLSLSEIIQQYSFLAPRFVIPTVSNLVLYYDPSNTSSYTGTGVTMSNLASGGGGLSSTLANISYTSPYLTYNGNSSQVSVADNALLEPGSGDWTVEVWINHSVITGASRCVMSKTNGGNSADWGYGIRTNSAGATYFEVGNGTTSTTSPSFNVTTGIWYQIVGVWTNVASNSIALYVNGVSQGSNSHSFASVKDTTRPLSLGSFDGGATFGQWINGRMGVVRMYNKALTGEEVLVNYVADKDKYQ
jgi:hypothetical protein